MKLRISRRIKVEEAEDSSDEDSSIVQSATNNTNQTKEKTSGTTNKSTSSTTFVNDGGFNSGMGGISGVPTRTTSTVTPTMLRNIDQTFQDHNNDYSQSGPYSAGFVPPPAPQSQNQITELTLPSYQAPMRQQQQTQQQLHQVVQQQQQLPAFINEIDPNSMDNSMDSSSMSESSWQTPTQDNLDDSQTSRRRGAHHSPGSSSETSNQPKATTRRNTGGRKPTKQSNLTPEEEQKRRVRRERNKQAAARCRKRREDHTSELQGKVDELEENKRQLTAEIQQLSQLKDELYELIEEHKRQNTCVKSDRSSPNDVKPILTQNVTITTSANIITTTVPQVQLHQQQNNIRPTSFVINNNNNNMLNANKLTLKIKAEPLEDIYDDEPPRKRKCDMLSGQEFDLCTPTPTTPYMPQLLTPTLTSKSQKPNRPSFLPVPANLKPSDLIAGKNVSEIAGVAVNTPSTGMFNFDSLMDGGTGLTPVTTLVPCSTQNRNPLDMLQTPTSESSKNLCSL